MKTMRRLINAKNLDDLEPGFGHWVAGLTDGEGSFLLKHHQRQWWTEFTIKLRDDDQPMLEMIRAELGRGSCYPSPGKDGSRPQYALRFHSATDTRFIVQLFKRFPLKSKKAKVFNLWVVARQELDKPVFARDLKYLKYLERAIRDTRRYEQLIEETYTPETKQMALAIK